jgi:hypothetical protein
MPLTFTLPPYQVRGRLWPLPSRERNPNSFVPLIQLMRLSLNASPVRMERMNSIPPLPWWERIEVRGKGGVDKRSLS